MEYIDQWLQIFYHTFMMKQTRQTPSAKFSQQKTWLLIDANNLTLGRLASYVANILQGKHKATYTPHADMGEGVIIVNASKVALSGNKRQQKTYYWHTGYPGGIKQRKASDFLDGDYPERVIMKAVKGMLPKGPLSRKQLKSLRVFKGEEHDHSAQTPKIIDFKSFNNKNYRSN